MRKRLPSLFALLALAGCAQLPAGQGLLAGERIIEVASGRELSRAELLQQLRDSDYVLLGEQHDNALHHQRRGELLQALGAGVPVV
ncbi:MAG TPA: ChaN family lipoprotein, partial [Roseateles sp.]|nr:ChaN family lipoprotein [Roseateles sp.]